MKTKMLIFLTFTTLICNAQVSKTIYVSTAGTLSTYLTTTEKQSITDLTVLGNIDYRDFCAMKNEMVVLENITMPYTNILLYVRDAYFSSPSKTIPSGAFSNKTTLKSFIYTSNQTLSAIGSGSFQNCTNLVNVVFGNNNITSIYDGAFSGCINLANLTLPTALNSIGNCAFQNCYALTSITFPETLTSIGGAAFDGCTRMLSITAFALTPPNITNTMVFGRIDKSNCRLYVKSGSLGLYKNANVWKEFVNIMPYTLSKAITITNAGTLSTLLSSYELSNITDLTVVGKMDARDFKTIRDKMISLNKLNLSSVSIIAYSGTEGTASTTYETYNANSIPEKAFSGKLNLAQVVLPLSALCIDSYSFENCVSLASIDIPSNVSVINEYAFYNCSDIITAILPNALTIIGNGAFENCTNLQTMNIPNTILTINERTFKNCNKLQTISLPAVLECINNESFMNCSSLQEIMLPESLTVIGNRSFYNCMSLLDINIDGTSIFSIGTSAFENCYSLSSITIPSTLVNYRSGVNCFKNCLNLNAIHTKSEIPFLLVDAFGPLLYWFDGVDKNNCILFVPFGSKSLYENSVEWRDFTNILEELGMSRMKATEKKSNEKLPEIRTINGYLTILNLKKDDNVIVYSTQGRILYKTNSNSESLSWQLPYKGVYIIDINYKIFKIGYF